MQKIVLYLTSKAMRQTISHSIAEKELATFECNNQIGNTICLEDYMKTRGYLLSENDVDYLVIDLSALIDSDEQIAESISGFMLMHENIRIIIVSPKSHAGDKLLSILFGIGVRNFAVGDYIEIKQSLLKCMSDNGMSYKDAIEYKDAKEDVPEVREIREVNKVMIGLAGTQGRVGCTHNTVIIANQLRKMGFAVACIEMNPSGAFQLIRQDEKINMTDMYFARRNIDYYPDADDILLKKILDEKVYNFLVLDFGSYEDCRFLSSYNRCHVKIAIGNVQPWEIHHLGDFCKRYDDEARKEIYFYVNFLQDEKERKMLEKTFKAEFGTLHFGYIPFSQDPFGSDTNFPGLKKILEDYLPTEVPKRRGLFGGLRKGKKVAFL